MNRFRVVLALAGLALLSSGFDWVGEIDRLVREYRVANVPRRREIIRLLTERDGARAHAALVAALSDPNDDVRREAMDACARAGFPEAWPALAGLVVEGSAETRASAARGLGRSRDATFLPVLVRALGDAEPVVRAAALDGLAALADESSRGPIEGRLDDDDPRVRAAAAAALAALGSPLATAALVSRVADDTPEVRLAVVRAIGALADPSSVSALEMALDDESEPVRIAAALAIARVRHPRTVAILRARLEGATTVARTAAAGLGAIGTDEALATLVDAALAPSTKLTARAALVTASRRDVDVAHRVAVLLAARLTDARGTATADEAVATLERVLEERADPAVTAALVRVVERERSPTSALIAALGRSGGEEALVPLLGLATRGGDGRTRDDALRAIVTLLTFRGPDGRVADPLLEALTRSTRAGSTVAIVTALGHSGAERAVPTLITLTRDDDASIRSAAFEALGRVGSPLGTETMLTALASTSTAERRAARRALARTLDAAGVRVTLERVAAEAAIDRVAALEAVAEAMPRIRADLDRVATSALLEKLAPLVTSPRGEIAALAIEIASGLGSDEARALVSRVATSPGPSRVEALYALATVSGDDALGKLREAIADTDANVRAAALVSLGERGAHDDLDGIVRAGTRGPWSVTLASSFALARLARRGLLVAADADALCTIGLDRDPVVRANLLVARAVLGTAACRAPIATDAASEAFVRTAEVRAARAARADVSTLCDAPLEAIVRAACDEATFPTLDARASVTAFDADGHTVLAERFVAVALSDGTVMPAMTSRAARVSLEAAPRGPMMLFDPSRTALER